MITEKSFHCPSEARTHDLPIPLSVTVGRCNQLSHGARIELPNEEIYQPRKKIKGPDLASLQTTASVIFSSTGTMSLALMSGIKSQRSQRSDRFWFYDGSVLVSLAPLVYKVHKSILDRHSSKFTLWLLDVGDPAALALSRTIDDAGSPVIVIPGHMDISVEDFETLLAHLYHDS